MPVMHAAWYHYLPGSPFLTTVSLASCIAHDAVVTTLQLHNCFVHCSGNVGRGEQVATVDIGRGEQAATVGNAIVAAGSHW